MALATSAPAKTACGCGGKCGCGGSCGGTCGCGGLGRPDGLQRPRFFAGQLLTPEDLSLIVDYAVGKARLRNQLLFGEGVVCGLTATCHPCGDGTVLIAPGYALDCCGNEIYLPCPEEVNVNRLVRDLRLRQLDGWDCGDPCEARPASDNGKPAAGRANDQPAGSKPRPPSQRYCLYICYDERQIEPVAPYVSDLDCSQVSCEPTRIVETHRFELRCPVSPSSPADLFAALKACIGDLRRAADLSRQAQTAQAMAMQLKTAVARVRAGEAVDFTEADTAELNTVVRSLMQAPPTGASEEQFRHYLADYETAVIGLARLRWLASTGRMAAMPDAARQALEVLGRAGAAIREFAPNVLTDELTRTAALELVSVADRLVANVEEPAPEADANRLLEAGAPVSASELARLRLGVAQLKAFLTERLSQSSRVTRCDLLDRVHAVRLPDFDDTSIDSVDRVADAADRLGALLIEYLRNCVCLALNPPCAPPCDDMGVLLACIEVRDCGVVEICNMSRQFVLSPSALRYWLPPLGWIGTLLERACCEPDARAQPSHEPLPGRFALQSRASHFLRSVVPKANLDSPLADFVAATGIDRTDLQNVASIGSQLGILAARNVPALQRLSERVEAPAVTAAEIRRTEAGARAELQAGLRAELQAGLRAEATSAARAGVQEAARRLRAENTRLRNELQKVTGDVSELGTTIDRLTESVRALAERPESGGSP